MIEVSEGININCKLNFFLKLFFSLWLLVTEVVRIVYTQKRVLSVLTIYDSDYINEHERLSEEENYYKYVLFFSVLK
jgi:hypothetical protein